MIKNQTLLRGNIISIVGAIANDYDGQKAIVPAWKRGMSNTTTSSGGGEYDGGDRVIGHPNGFEVDGDLLFTVGWGDGFAVRRLNNDGSMTRLFYDDRFLWRDTTNNYNHIQSVAIDRINKKGVVMTYNVDGYTTFDYSGLMNGGTTFVKDTRPTHDRPQRFIGGASNSVNLSSVGLYYSSGLVAAGEWIYAGEYDARHYKKVCRRNLRTGVEELLEADGAAVYPGSANCDRSGYRHWLFYDEVNDRVFYNAFYNSNFILVLDASTSNPKTVWCDCGDAGVGDDGYEQGVFIPDPVNDPYKVMVGANSRFAYLDIEPCLTGTKPTVLKQFYVEDATKGAAFGVQFRSGVKYQGYSAPGMDRNPDDKFFCPTSSDRGRNMLDGWIDFDNERVVGVERHDSTTEDTTTGGRGRSYRSDYSCPIFRMYSANNTPYWVKVGYGYDGHSFKVWDNSIKNELISNWEIVYGTYTLDNSAVIDFVHLNNPDHYVPSGCSLSYFVSNNNGSTWESYSGNETTEHKFSSTGTQLRIKYVGNGQTTKGPYKMSSKYDTITFGSLFSTVKDATIKYKVTSNKIKGKK